MINIKALVIIKRIKADFAMDIVTFTLAPIKTIEGCDAFLGKEMDICLTGGSEDSLYMESLFLNNEALEMTFSGVADKKIPPPPPNTGGIIKKGI